MATSDSSHSPTVDEESVATRVDTLADELAAERAARQELESELEAERAARETLEAQLTEIKQQQTELKPLLEAVRRRVSTLSAVLFGEDGSPAAYEEFFEAHPPLVEMIERYDQTAINELQTTISDECDRLAAEDAKLRRELNLLAEAVDAEVTEADVVGDDKIIRVMRNGPEAVETTVSPVDRRAAAVLRNIDRWGQLTSDAYGDRFVVTAGEAKDRLQDARNESLASVQIKRVFEKLEAWGADSPRTVQADCSGEQNRLVIEITDAE